MQQQDGVDASARRHFERLSIFASCFHWRRASSPEVDTSWRCKATATAWRGCRMYCTSGALSDRSSLSKDLNGRARGALGNRLSRRGFRLVEKVGDRQMCFYRALVYRCNQLIAASARHSPSPRCIKDWRLLKVTINMPAIGQQGRV